MCVAVGLIERYAKEGENLFSFSFFLFDDAYLRIHFFFFFFSG
jgi:hypothetical protein